MFNVLPIQPYTFGRIDTRPLWIQAMYSRMALKVGVRAHLDPHSQKIGGHGPRTPQDRRHCIHFISATQISKKARF